MAFSPDCEQLVSGSKDGTICLWLASTGEPIGPPFGCHNHWVTSVAFAPDGQKIVSSSCDRTVCLWDGATSERIGQPLEASEDYSDWVISVAFTTDGKYVVAESFSGRTIVWRVDTASRVGPHIMSSSSCELSPFVIGRSWLRSVRDLRLLCGLPKWIPDGAAWTHRHSRAVLWDGCRWLIIDISRVLAHTLSQVHNNLDLTTCSVEGMQSKVCLKCHCSIWCA